MALSLNQIDRENSLIDILFLNKWENEFPDQSVFISTNGKKELSLKAQTIKDQIITNVKKWHEHFQDDYFKANFLYVINELFNSKIDITGRLKGKFFFFDDHAHVNDIIDYFINNYSQLINSKGLLEEMPKALANKIFSRSSHSNFKDLSVMDIFKATYGKHYFNVEDEDARQSELSMKKGSNGRYSIHDRTELLHDVYMIKVGTIVKWINLPVLIKDSKDKNNFEITRTLMRDMNPEEVIEWFKYLATKQLKLYGLSLSSNIEFRCFYFGDGFVELLFDEIKTTP